MAGVITAIKAYKTLLDVGEGLAGCLGMAVKPDITPGEMAELNLKPEMIKGLSGGDVTIQIEQ